jgi:16S rRNA (guanine966-N2)-methyltransferase
MPSIRILGGNHKQKSIQLPHHEGLRPTSHRVRQTAFDILVHRFYKERIGQNETFSGLRILDICAGLGGYGFEALSRGAHYVTFIEQAPSLAKQLSNVAGAWNVSDRVRVFSNAWPMPLGPGHQPYDILFFDPPYGQEDAAMIRMIGACAPWMIPTGILLVESNHALPEIEGFSCVFVRTIGKKHLSFLQLIVEEPSAEEDPQAVGKPSTTWGSIIPK